MVALAEVVDLPAGRVLFVDEQGRGLRATWHLDRGFVNLSVWRGDRCSETFRLNLGDAARLVAFLVDGLSEATAELFRAVTAERQGAETRQTIRQADSLKRGVRAARQRVASWLAP